MGNFILTRSSTIMCPHGGIITHIPVGFTDYRINGEIPMTISDRYMIAGCPAIMPVGLSLSPNPCFEVTWVNASNTFFVNGSPALINTSVGLCRSVAGIPQGPAIIAFFQTRFAEPREFTRV